MVEQHINEAALRKKIISLFDYRLFPELMSTCQDNNKLNIFNEDLIALQSSIYYLDAHLEAHWETDPAILAYHWKNIINSLNVFGVDYDNSMSYLNHIKKYEKHELELRKDKSPLRFDMEYFYFYKSCDVKLLRRLIYENFKVSPIWGNISDWRYYDLVTEVNDDVEDVFEDLDFINGNRFLISLIQKGKQATMIDFEGFFQHIAEKANSKYKVEKPHLGKLLDLTTTRINETKELMYIQLQKISNNDLRRSKLMQNSTLLVTDHNSNH